MGWAKMTMGSLVGCAAIGYRPLLPTEVLGLTRIHKGTTSADAWTVATLRRQEPSKPRS